MLQSVEWGEFRVGDLFEIKTSAKRFDANKVEILETGIFPYVVRTANNNGIKGYLNQDEKYLNPGNTISFGQDTATIFYQETPYFTGDKIKIIQAKNCLFGKKNVSFIISSMMKAFNSFSWGNSSFSTSVIENQILQLPVTATGEIDFTFMESFIAELEVERIADLEAYLSVTGLKDYELTAEEKLALERLSNLNWKEFRVIDLFKVKNTANILSRDIIENSGETPYLSARQDNNSVSSYISYDENLLDRGNCIFIGGKTFVVTYQAKDFYSNDSHNLCLYLREEGQTGKLKQIFMVSCVEKSLGYKYSWGNSISNKKIQTDVVLLPRKDNQPDYDYMHTLISAVQKLVIKDVVQYADKKIAATRQVCHPG